MSGEIKLYTTKEAKALIPGMSPKTGTGDHRKFRARFVKVGKLLGSWEGQKNTWSYLWMDRIHDK